MILKPIYSFLREQIILIAVFGVLGGLALIILIPILVNITFGDDSCSLDTRPAPPVLLSVTQDPQTLVVTAEARDESDNEQWFSLGRTLITRNNQVFSVGTDIKVADANKAPVSRDTGRIVIIRDDGEVTGNKPAPGEAYVYTVRALNCWGPSARSNDISLVALSPS